MPTILEALRFAMGAVSKKEFIPTLTHFRIENSTVRSYNGSLALCSSIPVDIDCTPKAEVLYKAIQQCDDELTTLSLTPTGKLRVQSGKFRALVDCVTEEPPHVIPEGEVIDIDGEQLLAALKAIAPFIGDDASRPWSNGVMLLGQSAFATNNVILVEYWIGTTFPFCINIPAPAIREMLRIGSPPVSAQVASNSVTFHYPENKWVRSQLLETEWPDLNKVLSLPGTPTPIDPELFVGLEKLRPFVNKVGAIVFTPMGIKTSKNDEGSSYDISDFNHNGCYNVDMLRLLKDVVKEIDFGTYPKPCMFRGDRLRGAIIGMMMHE